MSNSLEKMSIEQGLYAQAVMIRTNYLDHNKEKENTKKCNFQGKSARSMRWFYINHYWLKENLSTC